MKRSIEHFADYASWRRCVAASLPDKAPKGFHEEDPGTAGGIDDPSSRGKPLEDRIENHVG